MFVQKLAVTLRERSRGQSCVVKHDCGGFAGAGRGA